MLDKEQAERLEEILKFTDGAIEFAYGKGLHEIGYDPVVEIRKIVGLPPKP